MEVTRENFQEAIRERDRMAKVIEEYTLGHHDPARLPSDVHEYYGRLQELEPQIERVHREQQSAEEYDRQMADAKLRGYQEAVVNLSRQPHPEMLETLQRDAAVYRHLLRTEGVRTFDEQSPAQSLLSQDDYFDAYSRGGNKAVQEWYFEQKRQLQLGRKYEMDQAETQEARDGRLAFREAVEVPRVLSAVERAMRERQLAITTEAAETVAFSTAEYNAAINYVRGKTDGYNETRDALIRHNPGLEKDLPPALLVDEIRVRQVTQDQERTQDIGLAVAR